MAIYVTSDAHGHVRALDEALSKISLTSDDTLYVLGDMIDRGPDPVGVIKLVRSLPNAHVLKGNHEQIMLDAIIGQDPLDAETWDINGGWTTREQLNDMEFEAYEELVRWMAALPLYAVVETEERPYLLVHAGIEMKAARAFLLEHGVDCADGVGAVGADRELLQQMLAVQSSDDLLWIRHGICGAYGCSFVDFLGCGHLLFLWWLRVSCSKGRVGRLCLPAVLLRCAFSVKHPFKCLVSSWFAAGGLFCPCWQWLPTLLVSSN